jgi:hypothetical protein
MTTGEYLAWCTVLLISVFVAAHQITTWYIRKKKK